MAERNRIGYPPTTGVPALDAWLRQLVTAINEIPQLSFFSGNPAVSGVTGGVGDILINVSPSSATTQRIWVNTSGKTSSWSCLVYV